METTGGWSGVDVKPSAEHAKGTVIDAGTSEIQRNIIVQHVLGLPRSY